MQGFPELQDGSSLYSSYLHSTYCACSSSSLAIEEGFAIHFSDGGTGGANEIILESLEDIIYREGVPFTEVHYNHEEVEYRFLARNRALLSFSGKWNYAGYNLFLTTASILLPFARQDGHKADRYAISFKMPFL